ncbi:MAG: hypothetical protein U1C51_05860, partial [Candidatus Izemoplasmatales bacterium]|nr:hypothetical protein [Candidatus Izemoplasmatales bacterium]
VIETANDLFQFSQLANGVNKQVYLSLSYVLGNDIDYSDASRLGRFFRTVGFTPNGNPDPMKTPIQNQAENPLAFQGSFDGQGFEISNLLLESITFSEYSTTYLNSLEYFSMFSVVGSNGVIQNVGFINPIYVQAINYGVMVGASVVAGANHGNINHVYYIDNRASSEAGLNVNGNFHLSGLVVRNYGVLEDSFVATPRIKATSVSANASVSYLVHQIFGSTARLYYNSTIGLDTPNANETTRGLSTSAFQVSSNFSAKWFFNNSYLVANQLSNTYPILKGFKRLSGAHYISTAADLVYFTKIINQPFNFNTVNFQITADIDMSSVSRYAIVSTITNYTNTFQSRLISTNPTGILYVRTPGDNNFFSILNLSLLTANDQGTYAGMGLFGSVSGTIRDLNFFNVNVKLNNSSTFTSEEFIAVGSIVTRLNGGTINNVNVFSTISIDPGLVKRVYVGGLVGFGNGTITLSTSNGSINGGIHPYVSDHANSAIGGFVGYSGNLVSATLGMNINNSVNRTSITGIGFSSTPQGYQNIGGFIGTGVLVSFVNIVNEANILSHAVNSMADGLSMGGIIGYLLNTTTSNTNIVSNYGTISVVINRIQKVRIGVGFGVGANVLGTTARTYNNINNYGTLNLIKPNQEQLLESDFQAMNVLVAGIFLTHNLALTLDRATNYADFEIDLNYIQQFAGVLFVNQNFVTGTNNDFRDYFNNTSPSQTATQGLNRATNFGNIHAFTSGTLYTYLIKISGISLGKGPSLFLARNEGDISVELNHDAPYELANAPSTDNIALNQKNIIITGVAEDILSSRRASALYNSGHLKLTSDPTKNIKFHVFVSGIIHRNRNTTTTITTNIAHLLLNDGYIDVSTSIQGNVRAAGIVSINSGTIQSSINAGDVRAVNATKPRLDALNPDTDFLVDAAGIAAMNVSTSTSTILMNAVNYGDIIAHSTTAHGRAVAAGILARNNRREDQRALINGDSYFATQIRHSINYGTIYSWNERVEDFAVKSEAFAISGG